MIDLIINPYNIAVLLIGGGISWWFYNAYKKTKSRALLNSLPGVFTSLGLLCTFISICASLHDISDKAIIAVSGTDKTLGLDIKNIIRELIPAFTSSIVGLVCALATTVWAKWVFSKEEAVENERLLNRSPEEYIQDIAVNSQILGSIESILRKVNLHQERLVVIQEKQEEKYREYNEHLNNNISHQNEILKDFIDGFVNRMDKTFEQMHGAIEQQVKAFGEEQFSKASNVLATITENLSRISTEIISQQKSSVETMMTKTNEDISGISNTLITLLGKLTTSLSGSLDNLGTQQSERLASIMTNYDNLATKLSEQNTAFAEKINTQLNDEFAKVQQHNTDSLKKMIELQGTYKELTSDMLTNALSMNEKSVNNLRESIGSFVSDLQTSLSSQCEILGKSISDNVGSLNKAYAFIESLVAEIKQNYDQAVLAYGDAVNVAHRTNENSEKAIVATSKSLESVADTNKMIDSVLSILTERQDNIETLTKQISSMSATIESLQKLEATLNKIANK